MEIVWKGVEEGGDRDKGLRGRLIWINLYALAAKPSKKRWLSDCTEYLDEDKETYLVVTAETRTAEPLSEPSPF